MRSTLLILVLGTFAAPAVSAAQIPALGEASGTRIAPFLGYSPGYATRMDVAIVTDQGAAVSELEAEVGGGITPGVAFEYDEGAPIRLVGSVMFSKRGEARTTVLAGGESRSTTGPGGSLLIATLGGGYRMEAVPAVLRVSPALVRVYPAEADSADAAGWLGDPVNHFAAAVGGTVSFPMERYGMTLDLAVEDLITFWNERTLADRLGRMLQSDLGITARTGVRADHSHLLVVRAGVSIRLGTDEWSGSGF